MSLFQTNAASFKIGNVTIYSATTLPDNQFGKIGDVFLTTVNPNIYIKNQNNEWDFLNYPIGYAGSRGFTGSKGNTGEGLDLQGTLTDINDLPVTGEAGDGYIIGSDLYVWDGAQWENVGQFVGYTGSQGVIGYTGSKGDIGFTGSQGDIGFTGSQGDIGFTGSQGDIGFTGSQGDIGFTGSQGVIGYTGSKGDIGEGLNILGTLNNIGELPASGNVGDAYIISGDLHVWDGTQWLNVGRFVGYTGSQGGIGYTGSQGVIGYTGSQGAIGFTGQKGDAGFTGSQGATGFTGSTGTLQSVTDNGNTTTNEIEVEGVDTPYTDFDITSELDADIEGRVKWDVDEETLSMGVGNDHILLSQETVYHVKNDSGSSIPKGTLVMANGTLGASGKIMITTAISDGSVEQKMLLGLTKEDIGNNAEGYVTHFGKLRGVDTSMYSEGTILYANPSVVGGLTATVPEAPNLKLVIAIVITSHASVGTLFVRPTYGQNLSNDELVQLSNIQDGQVIAYNSQTQRFENINAADLDTGATSQFTATGGVSSTLTTTLSTYLTVPSQTIYKIESLHFQNISANEETVSVYIDENVGQLISLGYNIPIPAGSAIELNYNTTAIKAGDTIQMNASANSQISSTISYSIDQENIWFGNGFKLVSADTEYNLFESTSTNGSELISLKVSNIGQTDVTVTAYSKNGANTIQSYYCFNMVIPANATVELFMKAKHLPDNHSVRISSTEANVIDVYLSGLNIA